MGRRSESMGGEVSWQCIKRLRGGRIDEGMESDQVRKEGRIEWKMGEVRWRP